VLAVCAAVGLVLVVGAGLIIQHHLVGQMGRFTVSYDALADRPDASPAGSSNVLVVAGDGSRDTFQRKRPWSSAAAKTAELLVVHFDAAGRSPTVVAIPGTLPTGPGSGVTFSGLLTQGSATALVGAVEKLSGVRIDHVAVVSWDTFARLTDWVGGVQVDTGRAHLLPGSEVRRFLGDAGLAPAALAARQQSFLGELMDQSLHQEMRKYPWLLYHFLDIVTSGMSVDSGWSTGSMRGMLWSLRNQRSASISYVVLPLTRPKNAQLTEGPLAQGLWQAVRQDHAAEWLGAHPEVLASATTS